MEPRKHILFLFTELAGYIIAGLKHFADQYPVEIHVIRYPVNREAPFNFSFENAHITYYQRENLDAVELIRLAGDINPDIIFCSGWTDKGYLKVCHTYHKMIPVVLTLDNPWKNTLKQHIATLVGPYYLRQYFTHCWVPGVNQKNYAVKLGFPTDKIQLGFYSCDFELFHSQYLSNRQKKEKNFPRKIIYVGRYVKLKGIQELWDAFIQFHNTHQSDWELWCLGKGDLEPQFPSHPKIKNIGFVQPSEMNRYIEQCGVFILPTHTDHWGVVIHEFAAAGFPILSTTAAVAASTFVKDQFNGFLFNHNNPEDLLNVIEKVTRLTDDELLAMGDRSAEMATQITPATWSSAAMNFLNT